MLPTRDINFPVIFDISTNPKGDVKLTSPICQDERWLIFSKIYGGIIKPKDVVPPKTNIANIEDENDMFLNKRKLMIGWLVFSSHTINKQKVIINIKKLLYTDILKKEWWDQDVKLTNNCVLYTSPSPRD